MSRRDRVPAEPEPTEATPDPVEDTPDVTRPDTRRRIVVSPEVQAAVDAMPPLRPEQIAQLRRILHDWPDGIRERVEARQRAAAEHAA